MKRFFQLLVVLTCALLVSCSTATAFMKSNITGLPIWYYDQNLGPGKNKKTFVGVGTSDNERNAQLIACSNAISLFSSYLGYDLGREEYRELISIGTISEYGIDTLAYSVVVNENQTSVYVLIGGDPQFLESLRSLEIVNKEKTSSTIKALVDEGDSYMKEGQDIKALKSYLSSLSLSYNEDVGSNYSFSTVMADAISILEDINLKITSSDTSQGKCTITVSRNGTRIFAPVSSASIIASYVALDPKGSEYNNSYFYSTDENGVVVFQPLNPAIKRKGEVSFSLDLSEELEELGKVVGQDAIKELEAVISSKKITFSYDMKYSVGGLAISVQEYDSLGNETGNEKTAKYLATLFEENEALCKVFSSWGQQEDDVLYEYQMKDGAFKTLMICRFGVQDYKETSFGFIVTTEGSVALYDTESGKVILNTAIVYGSGKGETYQEALEDAFEKTADIVYSVMKGVYV
ncbi:MAG: hypothetical protein HUK24_06195 [Sphaerochaetaceae bacterium]|nr:hypothetical protein [Sphaerochaetaceae bacterium]